MLFVVKLDRAGIKVAGIFFISTCHSAINGEKKIYTYTHIYIYRVEKYWGEKNDTSINRFDEEMYVRSSIERGEKGRREGSVK